MERKTKAKLQEAGITLVALVVTIIVLLILAGITIRLALSNNGIIQRAKDSSETWKSASVNEEKMMGELYNDIYIHTEGYANLQESSETGSRVTRSDLTPAPTGTTYMEGDEVTLGSERFFVLSDNGTEIKLLAKYCLNKAGTIQDNSTQSLAGTGRLFSKTNYWSNVQGITYPYNLQTSEMIAMAENDGNVDNEVKNAVITARDYGDSLGVSKGRLMTKVEAENIIDGDNSMLKEILSGTWDDSTKPVDGYLMYYLGDAYMDTGIWTVNADGYLYFAFYKMNGPGWSTSEVCDGVRPILEIQ